VRRAINSLDPFHVTIAREGLEAARKKFRPVGQGLNLTRPLQRVDIDEATVDLVTFLHSTGLINYLSEEERASMGLDGSKARWMMSVAICCTTRCIVGMVLTRTATANAAVQTLQMIVSDKGQWADMVGALGSWDMHGTPESIVTDCGTAYQSEEFRFACSDLGVTAQRAVAGFPEMRGWIERLFGTITHNLMPRLAGRTFSDIITKGDADPRDRAALTVEDLLFALVRWTVDIYHNMPHQGLDGETPLHCWRRLTKKWGVQSPPDLRRQRLVFGSRLKRSLDKNGVTVLNVRYHSERLATWMNRKDECRIDVRWHPHNIGAIEARLGDDWVEVPAVEDGLDGVSAQVWLAAGRELRATDPTRKGFDRSVIHKAIKAIDERNAAAIATAGLLVPDWSQERIQREENRNLISFAVSGGQKSKKRDGKLGQSIPNPEGYDPSAAIPVKTLVKKSRSHKHGSKNFSIKDYDE
jgi:putative transposase